MDRYTSAKFSLDESKNYNLSLLLGADRLSYLVHAQKEVLALGGLDFVQVEEEYSLVDAINQAYDQREILRAPYQMVQIYLRSNRVISLPLPLYQAQQQYSYFEALLPIDEGDYLLEAQMPSLDLVFLQSVRLGLKDQLQDLFPQANIYSALPSLLQISQELIPKLPENNYRLLAYFSPRSIQLMAWHKDKLLLHQLRPFRNAEDCLYYLLWMYKELGLSPKKIPLYFGGELTVDSAIHQLLYTYIVALKPLPRPQDFAQSDCLAELEPQRAVQLLATIL